MSSAASSGRKKPRTKETKPPLSRARSGSTFVHPPVATVAVDDAGASALTDAPYVCTGRFGVDFVQLCRRAQLTYIPFVVARPHRPTPASVAEEKKSVVPGPKSTAKMRASVVSDPMLAQAAETAEGLIPEPPPKTFLLRDSISFFRPSVQVPPFISLSRLGDTCRIVGAIQTMHYA